MSLPEARRGHQPRKVVLADGQGPDSLQAAHVQVIHARCDFSLIGEAVDFTTGVAQYRHYGKRESSQATWKRSSRHRIAYSECGSTSSNLGSLIDTC